jgi:hypothetical protein
MMGQTIWRKKAVRKMIAVFRMHDENSREREGDLFCQELTLECRHG